MAKEVGAKVYFIYLSDLQAPINLCFPQMNCLEVKKIEPTKMRDFFSN